MQYIVLLNSSIAIQCIVNLKYCNTLYCIFTIQQYNNNTIVRSPFVEYKYILYYLADSGV
jgi:hypothetical protein